MLRSLVNENIQTLMVEGCPRVLTSFMQSGLADELALFIAPRILDEEPGLGTGLVLNSVKYSINIRNVTFELIEPYDENNKGELLLRGRFACSPDL